MVYEQRVGVSMPERHTQAGGLQSSAGIKDRGAAGFEITSD